MSDVGVPGFATLLLSLASSSFAISGEIIRHISSDGSSGLNRCTPSPRQYKEVNCICVPE